MSFILAAFCSVCVLIQPLFFSSMGIMGINYEGSESSGLYIYFTIFMAAAIFLIYIGASIVYGVGKRESIALTSLLGIISLHFLWVILDGADTELSTRFFELFIVLGLPGFFAATIVLKCNIVIQTVKAFELFVILIAIGVTFYSALPTLSGELVKNIGGASYQSLSYYSAFSFGMLLTYNNLLSNKGFRFRLLESKLFKIISIPLLVFTLFSCVLGGGRGAFLLLVMFLVFNIYASFKQQSSLENGGLSGTLVKVLFLCIVIVMFIVVFGDSNYINAGFERATQFISPDGKIDLESGSSGRDTVYSLALQFIGDSPVLGYGPFGVRDKSLHAHNIFLEIWLQFGVVGLFLSIILFFYIVLRIIKNWCTPVVWASSILLYPLTLTLFSGSYMHMATFFFSGFLVYSLSKES
ncbi:MAG: hypothetical protein CMF21_03275 [Idiomarinaceae bacterium]|nr:hypothetical protein [Idiomarinaceae bacterium]